MARAYHPLEEDSEAEAREQRLAVLTEAEQELLTLLKTRGVPSICDSISQEINYAWAVLSGFKTLANVGHFYFACGGRTFGYNPGPDFFAANGMQLAVFALHKFVHNERVLVPVLDCLHVYSKLHVEGALEFLAVADSKEILMKCVRFHDNKHDVIAAACRALGSLVMNDLVKESVSSPELMRELLGLLGRYEHSHQICRAVLVPLSFLVTDAIITATFVDANGIALTMTAMKRFVSDTELVWHAMGTLNGLHAKTLDIRLIYAIFGFTGISRLVEAVASHLDTEEVAVEGFQLLSRLAALPEAYRAVNEAKVLDLAYVALFAYSGEPHRHTRMAIKKTLHSFQKCTLFDPRELARRERASHGDVALYVLFLVCFLLSSAFALYDQQASDTVFAVRRAVLDAPWQTTNASISTQPAVKTLREVDSVSDVWSFLQGPLQNTLFQDAWYNGDSFATDVDSQLGVMDRTNLLLGGVQLRLIRVNPTAPCKEVIAQDESATKQWCYPTYSPAAERKTPVVRLPYFQDVWTAAKGSDVSIGRLAVYPDSGYRRFLPRLGANLTAMVTTDVNATTNATATTASASAENECDARCQLTQLRHGRWLDEASRALFVRFNLYNAALDLHCVVHLLFEFDVATAGNAEGGGGRVTASASVTPLHLRPYPGLFVLSPRFLSELGLLLGIGWFARKQLDKLLQYRLFYFVVLSHMADFAIVVLWAAVLVLRLQSLAQAAFPMLETLAASADHGYVELDANVRCLRTERLLRAACAMLMWWRLVRLAKTLKPLESTVDKLERAQTLLQSYAVLLGVYVLTFAHAGVLLFPSAHDSFGNLARGVATMAKALVASWQLLDVSSGATQQLFRLLFQFCTTFVVLNIVVAILRERFDTSRAAVKAAKADGAAMLALAKRQLEAHGIHIQETSLPKKLRRAASRGLEKLQRTKRNLLSAPDDHVKLTDLKKVWGLENRRRRSSIEPSDVTKAAATGRLPGDEAAQRLLASAEEHEQELDQQLGLFASRLNEMLTRLGHFQTFLGDELGSDALTADELIAAELQNVTLDPDKTKDRTQDVDGLEQETRRAYPAQDSSLHGTDDHATERHHQEQQLEIAASLPGAIDGADEEDGAVKLSENGL